MEPGRTAQELAQLAAQARHPAERVWFLAWAKAFRQLADLGAGSHARGDPLPDKQD